MTTLSDLGLANACRPADDIVSGGQPSPAQLRLAAQAGYKTVLTTRAPSELGSYDEQSDVESLGMAYLAIPVASGADLSPSTVRAFADAVRDAEKPLLIHCGSGNRIGALFALKAAWIDGKSADEALAEGRRTGLTGLEPAIRQMLY